MARDHALAATLADGEATLRFYRWVGPTLSLGRHEPARGRWDHEALERAGVTVVRRPTGGRAVLHHRELTYSVVLPLVRRPGVRALYRAINGALVHGLASLGVPVSLVGDAAVVAPLDSGPCFAGPAPGEVVAGGRKLVGSAQARVEGRLLQHGSLLLHDDQTGLEELRQPGTGSVAGSPSLVSGPPATLASFLDPLPSEETLVEALVDGFRTVLHGDWRGSGEMDTLTAETRAAEARLLDRYASSSWTWRR